MAESIVITGVGLISPLGVGKEVFWQGLLAGRQALAASAIAPQFGGGERLLARVSDFKAKEYIKRPVLKPLDMVTRYAIAGVGQALADAELEINDGNRQRVAIIAGSMYQGIDCIFKFKKACFENGRTHLSPLFFPGIVFNSLSGQAAIEHKIQGPNNTVSSGTGSGLAAVARGMDYILANKADVVIAGGAEMIHDFVFYKYDRLGRLASAAKGDERGLPFAAKRSGFVLGEGSCFFVLEREAAARARGATIHAVIAGHAAAYCPVSAQVEQGAALAGCLARSSAGQAPDVLVCDSSGCPQVDGIEGLAIKATYGATGPLLTANKGNIGHSLGASAAFNLCQGLMCLKEGQVPPLSNLEEPEFALNYTRQTTATRVDRVMVTSVDFNNNYMAMSLSKLQGLEAL